MIPQDPGHLAGPADPVDEEWLTPQQVCALLSINTDALRDMKGAGPPYLQISPGRRRYSRRGLATWMRDRVSSTPATGVIPLPEVSQPMRHPEGRAS